MGLLLALANKSGTRGRCRQGRFRFLFTLNDNSEYDEDLVPGA